MDNKVIFGNNIRVQRVIKKLSQEQLSQEAGLDRSYYASVERGERNVSLENIVKIANALETAPASLLTGIGEYR